MDKDLSFFLLAGLLLLTSCGEKSQLNSSQNTSKTGNIVISESQRENPETVDETLDNIGKLYTPDGGYCTASLVGEQLILTAAHCVYKDGEHLSGEYSFEIFDERGQRLAKSSAKRVVDGGRKSNGETEKDWAILKLKKSLGKDFGHFKTRVLKSLRSNWAYDVTVAGYGSQFDGPSLTLQECNVRDFAKYGGDERKKKVIKTDCDTSPGDSGAPIFKCLKGGGCFVLGVHI